MREGDDSGLVYAPASSFLLLWLGLAVMGILGLLHAAYSDGRRDYLGFYVAVVCAATIVGMLVLLLVG